MLAVPPTPDLQAAIADIPAGRSALRGKAAVPGTKPFTRGHLYQLLHNPIYIGRIAHKDKTYPGQHDAILDEATWDAVQERLRSNAGSRHSTSNSRNLCLLTGFLFDCSGDRLCPTYATKRGQRYRYYVSKRLLNRAETGDDGWRLPAHQLEKAVIDGLCDFLKHPIQWLDRFGTDATTPEHVRHATNAATALAERISDAPPSQQRLELAQVVSKIEVHPDRLSIWIYRPAQAELISRSRPTDDGHDALLLDLPVAFQRRGIESKIILSGSLPSPSPDQNLIDLVARTRGWFEKIVKGEVGTVREIARLENLDEGDVSRFLPLAFLAPDIVEAILSGRQPVGLTAERLKRLRKLPRCWVEQKQRLGFSA